MLKLTGLETIISKLQDIHAIANAVGVILENSLTAAVDSRDFEQIEKVIVCKHTITKEVSVHMNLVLSGAKFDKREYKLALNRILHNAEFKEGLIVEDADGGYW